MKSTAKGFAFCLSLAIALTLIVPVAPASAQTPFRANVNFQPAGAPVPEGYVADTGSTYGDRGNGFTYGWSGDSSAHTRDRNAANSPDQRYDTLNHMQYYGEFSWEIAVPNGTYQVHLVAGDPTHDDSVYKIDVEGVRVVDGTPSSATGNFWVEGTSVVNVSDGRLTVSNGAGASNNKINFIDITSQASFNANVNFQPASSPVPGGYVADTGAPYGDRGNGYTYGWNADNSGYTRDRDASNSPDQRYDTLNHTQRLGDLRWEIAVPNGSYQVHLVAGDPWYDDSVYKLDVEGVRVVDGTPSSATGNFWVEGTSVVNVSDGRLTVSNGAGASNNKIDFIDIYSTSSPPTGNAPPAQPRITAPSSDGQIVHPADVHMETGPFSDTNSGDTHACTDWEIWTINPVELVWRSPCNTAQKVHVHFGDGAFVNSYAGRSGLAYSTDYRLRARHKDSSGDAATEWSSWAERRFRTADAPPSGGSVAWTLRQSGFEVQRFATGLELPVNVAFVPNPGTRANDVFFYVTELYGQIKVVTRDGTVSDYLRGALNYRPTGIFPGSGEQGLTGIVVEPTTGDVFASMLYDPEGNTDGPKYPKVMR